jgi:hypothetical protein
VNKQPLRPSPWAEQLQKLFTTSISITEGTGADSYSVVGSFKEMLIGMRTTGVQIRRIPAGTATDADGVTHSAVDELKEWIVAFLRADVAILRPSWFTVLSGITTAG